MTMVVVCDRCQRECSGGFMTVGISKTRMQNDDGVRHYCHARHGGDVGCAPVILGMLREKDDKR